MIPIREPSLLAPIADGPVGVERFGVYLRRPCRVCGWRRLLTVAGQVFCTSCSSQATGASGRVDRPEDKA